MAGRRSVSRRVSLFAALAALALGIPVHASTEEEAAPAAHHHDSDFLLFPNVTGTHLDTPVSGLKQSELRPELDIFYSTDFERLRFLAEFLVNKDENEMERLQLGWLVQSSSTLWAGRFHTPLGFWNSEHHHGAYMQTTISRPSIIAFEDEGGVLPTHIAGLLAEGSVDRERGAINYAFGLGKGPQIAGSALEPMDIVQFENGGKLAASARLSYRPFEEGADEFGGFAGYAHIPVGGSTFNEVDQTVAGVFYAAETDTLRLIGELFYVSNHLFSLGPTDHADFSAGYLQAEYRAHARWTLFGRLEASNATKNNAYLDLIPEFLSARAMAGSRFEVARNHALKLELSRNERPNDIRFNQLSLQWSMVFP